MLIMSPINVVASSAWMLTVPGTALIPPRRGHPHHHPWHHWSHLTGVRTDQFNDLPKVTKPGRGGVRLALSPERTLNRHPGPLPRGRPMVITGEGEASAPGSTCPNRGGVQATPLPLPHLGMLKPPRLHASLPDGLNLGSGIQNSSDSAEH